MNTPIPDDTARNILFLLMAAPLSIGCGDDAGSSSTDAAGSSTGETTSGTTAEPPATTDPGTTTDAGTTDPTTTDPTTGVDSSSGGSDGSDSGSSGGSSGGSDSSDGSDSGSSGDADVCAAYGEVIGMCYGERLGPTAEMYCNDYIAQVYADYGAACAEAFEDYLACISTLPCDELMSESACEAEQTALVTAC